MLFFLILVTVFVKKKIMDCPHRFINRPALGIFPGANYPERVQNSLYDFSSQKKKKCQYNTN